MEGTRGRKSLMESRSRVVTGNSNIFCVAKLDWQFIGNIRLRGVTPSFRVPCNQQKSPPPLSISLSLYLSISNPCCPPHVVGCKFARSLERLIPEQGNDSIPVAAVNAPSPSSDTVPWTDATAASRPHLHHLRSFRRCLEWPP